MIFPDVTQQPTTSTSRWTPVDSEVQYLMSTWSDGYFTVNDDGHVVVSTQEATIDIRRVVDVLVQRGVTFPILIRFQDVLHGRVIQLNEAFREAIAELEYGNRYTGVYPIKVNQLHEVVEEVLDAGRPYGMGLECGSKAELVAALPHLESDDTLLICNGYKDQTSVDLILTGQLLGKCVIPVMEKYDEFLALMAAAEHRHVDTQFGVRVRLTTSGAGKWADSGGDLSKFGISIPELVRLMEYLSESDRTDAFKLLHFHLGSQISDIRSLKKAVKEITQVYVQLRERGYPVEYLDVGGGLGVNYGASYASDEDGINYSLQEYANAVVQTIKEVCDMHGAPHPIIISESGRALTAHHSVLVVNTLGMYRKDEVDPGFAPREDAHQVVLDLHETLSWISSESEFDLAQLLEAFHDAAGKRQEADTLFGFGYLSLEEKALAERLYWTICRRVNRMLHAMDAEQVLPPELEALDTHLVDQCLCDFSVFQSALDHWAIGQRFPIVPLQRLGEEPDRRAVLVDLTCDSDGKVSSYVSANDDRRFMDMHALRPDEPYYLGFFLMGAYQDIMGDTHNLFGRVSEAHVYADDQEEDGFYIEKIIPGTTVQDMLALVQYFPQDLHSRMNRIIRSKIDDGTIRPKRGFELLEQYKAVFNQHTYYTRHET
ncbi:MAG: arginine decarboxylase [Bacteroidetes bacterium CG12_big_fil_rev_8_21_14_0_65_60_17]|nr:MAG: arginine decarboxylase [Bacteroidetes bacterium CG12_big_fil_rev_8_21_14_0_65_60_17]